VETGLQIIAGLALLALGGEGVVRGAVGLARKFGVSELLIGLTVVGFGTSAPELITSVNAALAGSTGIAVGNVVGSNISNTLLIFGVIALARPVLVERGAIGGESAVMLGATALLIAIAVLSGELNRWVGIAFVMGLATYVAASFLAERRGGAAAAMHQGEVTEHTGEKPDPLGLSIALALGGLAMLVFGADLLVKGAVTLAALAGLSETVIGLTVVAVGTSLPELVASLAAALKGRTDVAIGNIIGSNLYNILGILGLTAAIAPLAIPPDIAARDWIALLGSAALVVGLAYATGRVGRVAGGLLVTLYGVYTILLLQGAQTA
jgi:cation:H+ antiporter